MGRLFLENVLQRILSRGEIEGLDHTSIPRVLKPVRASVFADRAARLKHLAQDHPAAPYLQLMANVVQAQHQLLKSVLVPPAPEERVSRAQAHGMPPLQALGWPRTEQWRAVLVGSLGHLQESGLPAPAQAVCSALQALAQTDPDALEQMADAVLAERDDLIDPAMAPFVAAALQVYWTSLACDFPEDQLPVVTPMGVCPLCGSLPVASVVRVGGREEGCRYLCCSLCSTQWHKVRVTCSHCDNTKDIAYHSIEGGPEGIKAESCDHCHTYRKIFYQEKDVHVDPVADDLASIRLDVLMGEAGYLRSSGNPLLWQRGD